jgi:DDE superfamily endonuclease
MKATQLWAIWQALLLPFRLCFTAPGFRRFVEWLTGLVLNVEEHTVTQSLIALDRPGDWKALEAFVEYGAWDRAAVERALARQLERAPGRTWYGYHVWAGDDTKVHRSSKDVWGVCTFHEYSARCPNRAQTVRAHNWVAVGALLHNPGQPAWYLPVAGRLYFRKAQLPGPGSNGEPPLTFRTKCQLLVEMGRQQAQAVPGRHLLAFDGAFAVKSVVRPLVCPQDGAPRVDIVTRLRRDARLYQRPTAVSPGQPGRRPQWGRRLAPPRQGGRWRAPWHEGRAFLYGRWRQVRWKEVVCLWRVLGPDVPVKAVVAQVEGFRKRFTVVTSAVALTGLQVVELNAARFRQEDGFRDLKQRLGWEECRAWTRQPIEATTTALFVALTLLRLLQFELEGGGQTGWWLRPPWNPNKQRPSVRDLGRLLGRCRTGMQRCLSAWLESEGKATGGQPKVGAM